MTHHDSHPSGDGEREALAMLVARFSADRDALAAGLQRAEIALRELAARLDGVAARANESLPAHELGPMRFEVGRLESLVESLRDDLARIRGEMHAPSVDAGAAAVDEVRVEMRRVATEQAERTAARVAESSGAAQRSLGAAIEELRIQLASGLDDVRRIAISSGERAAHALSQVAEGERREREFESLRTTVAQLREELLRRVGETEARHGVRLDSIVAGVEAETRAVRDALWDRVAGTEQRLHDAEGLLAQVRVQLPQTAAQALEGLAGVHGEIEQLRHRLGATGDRLASLEQRPVPRGGIGGMIDCVRDEVVAAVMLVVSIGAVVGRLTLSLVR